MNITEADPERVGVDPMNERSPKEVEIEEDFVANVEETGIIQPPMVREADDTDELDYVAVVGQRRTFAAQQAELDAMPVIVMDWDDEEALKASITENINIFRNRVPTKDRAAALESLWEMMGGSGMPVQSHLGAQLGVPRETIRTWLEPLHDGWKDTSIDPSSDTDSDAANELGEKALAIIRRMTGGGEEGESVAERAAELGLTQADLKEAKELVEEEDYEPMDAIEAVAPDDDDGDSTDNEESSRIEVNEVTFDPQTSAALEQASNDMDSPPAALILNAVDWFLREEGYLDGR